MNWNEMIEKRRAKEELVVSPFDPQLSCTVYQMNLERALAKLSPLERNAVILRFVRPLPIARVADGMGMSWDGANELIDRAVVKIRKEFPHELNQEKKSMKQRLEKIWNNLFSPRPHEDLTLEQFQNLESKKTIRGANYYGRS